MNSKNSIFSLIAIHTKSRTSPSHRLWHDASGGVVFQNEIAISVKRDIFFEQVCINPPEWEGYGPPPPPYIPVPPPKEEEEKHDENDKKKKKKEPERDRDYSGE